MPEAGEVTLSSGPEPPRPVSTADFFGGVAAVAVGHLLLFGLVSLETMPFVGVLQALYVWPLAVWARRRRLDSFRSGVLMIAAATLLLNATCGAIVWVVHLQTS